MNFNLLLLSPHYCREMWDYKHASTENILNTISTFDWQKAFKNKNTHEKTRILNNILINIFKNLIPHETKIFDCKTLKDFIKTYQIMIKIY